MAVSIPAVIPYPALNNSPSFVRITHEVFRIFISTISTSANWEINFGEIISFIFDGMPNLPKFYRFLVFSEFISILELEFF